MRKKYYLRAGAAETQKSNPAEKNQMILTANQKITSELKPTI